MTGAMPAIVNHREIRPTLPEGAAAEHVRVSRDLRRMAFSRPDGRAPGVYLEELAKGAAPALVCQEDVSIEGVGFSPDGEYIAYVVGSELPFGRERTVGWATDAGEEEVGRVAGAAFAWTPKGSLLVADLEQEALVQVNVETGVSRTLMPLHDDGNVAMPPRIVVSPKGQRVAVTCRRSPEGLTEVWVLERDGREVHASLLTQIPGVDVEVWPFWSPKGVTLGLGIVHMGQDQSAMVAVRRLQGDGEILYHRDVVDAREPPVWAPSSDAIAFFMAGGLALLDCKTNAVRPLMAASPAAGTPAFLDDMTLLMDGGAAAHLFTFDAPP